MSDYTNWKLIHIQHVCTCTMFYAHAYKSKSFTYCARGRPLAIIKRWAQTC